MNRVNGVPTCANSAVNNRHYRETLKWEGFMVSDCGAISDIAAPHNYAMNQTAGAAAGLNGGCDADCGTDYANLPAALAKGLVTEAAIDQATTRLLREQIAQGELDDPSKNPYSAAAGYNDTMVDSTAHRALALETAMQGIVLLANEAKLLPLREATRVAFVGPHANVSLALLGNYFGGNELVFEQTPLVAARRAGVDATYAPGVPCYDVTHSGSRSAPYPLCVTQDTSDHTHIASAVAAAKAAEVALLFIGNAAVNNSGPCSTMAGVEGEGCDRATIGLPLVQETMLRAVLAAQPKTVVVLMNGGAVAMPEGLEVPTLVEAFCTRAWHLTSPQSRLLALLLAQ
jgi:hypothetical protein